MTTLCENLLKISDVHASDYNTKLSQTAAFPLSIAAIQLLVPTCLCYTLVMSHKPSDKPH